MASSVEEQPQEIANAWVKDQLPSYGPDWDRAVEMGIDVTLLLENLELTPRQRLNRLQQVVRFHEVLRNARRSSQ